ncbi:hypothetical protein ACYJW8_08290 [Frateuria aurantia]
MSHASEPSQAYMEMRDVIALSLAHHEYEDASFVDMADHVIGALAEAGYRIVRTGEPRSDGVPAIP